MKQTIFGYRSTTDFYQGNQGGATFQVGLYYPCIILYIDSKQWNLVVYLSIWGIWKLELQ